MTKIVSLKLIILTILLLVFGVLIINPLASAQTTTQVCEGVTFTGGGACPDGAAAEGRLSAVVTRVVNIFSIIVGIASVVMIMFGGFRYITAGGDSGKISSAQQTIIYAIVGLVVVGFAQVIVRFVIAATSTT